MKLIASPARSILIFTLFALQNMAFSAPVSVLVTDKDGKPVMDAVVVLQHTQGTGVVNQLPKIAAVVNEKMQFLPAVSVVAPGARVRFVNNDPWDHHVRGAPSGAVFASNPAAYAAGASTGGFELRLEGKTEGKPAKFTDVTLDKIGAQSTALLGCFLHGSMRGHIYVSDSPWAGKTDARGSIQFDNVPEGSMQVRVWHADQLIDPPLQSATVGAGALQLKTQLPFTPRKPRAAATPAAYY